MSRESPTRSTTSIADVICSFALRKYAHTVCEGTQPVRDAWHHVESPDYSVLLEQRRRPNAMPELVKLWLVRGASDVDMIPVEALVQATNAMRLAMQNEGANTPVVQWAPIYAVTKGLTLALRYKLPDDRARYIQFYLTTIQDCNTLAQRLRDLGVYFMPLATTSAARSRPDSRAVSTRGNPSLSGSISAGFASTNQSFSRPAQPLSLQDRIHTGAAHACGPASSHSFDTCPTSATLASDPPLMCTEPSHDALPHIVQQSQFLNGSGLIQTTGPGARRTEAEHASRGWQSSSPIASSATGNLSFRTCHSSYGIHVDQSRLGTTASPYAETSHADSGSVLNPERYFTSLHQVPAHDAETVLPPRRQLPFEPRPSTTGSRSVSSARDLPPLPRPTPKEAVAPNEPTRVDDARASTAHEASSEPLRRDSRFYRTRISSPSGALRLDPPSDTSDFLTFGRDTNRSDVPRSSGLPSHNISLNLATSDTSRHPTSPDAPSHNSQGSRGTRIPLQSLGTNLTNVASRPNSSRDADHEIVDRHGVFISNPQTAPRQTDREQLANYANLPSAERMTLLQDFICEKLEDDNFLKLCTDVEACWQRIAFDR